MVDEEGRREAAKMGNHEESEMEMLLNEIPHVHHHHHHHHLFHGDAHAGDGDVRRVCVAGLDELSPLHGLPRVHGYGYGSGRAHACLSPRPPPPPPPLTPSEGSSSAGSCWLSGRLPPAVDELALQRTPSSAKDRMLQELSLLQKLDKMHLGVNPNVSIGFPPSNSPANLPLSQSNYRNDMSMETLVQHGYGAYFNSLHPKSLLLNVDKNPYLPQLQQHCSVYANSVEPWLKNFAHGATELGADVALGRNSHYNGYFDGGFASSINQPYPVSDIFLQSDKIRVDTGCYRNALDASNLHDTFPALNGRMDSTPVNVGPQRVRILRNVEALGQEDGQFIQGKGPHYMTNQWNDLLKQTRRSQFDDQLYAQGISMKLPTSSLKYDNMMGVKGRTYYIAKDQHGCRYLQRKLDEGKHQVDIIFNGVIDHAVELMVDPFGNYLIQKLLEVCSEEQLMQIILVLKEDPTDIVRLSLNIHGTRAVQKLIDTLKTRQQIALVISAIRPGFLDLIKDLNGSHVLQRCLEFFTAEDNKFIFEAAAKHCVDIATHRHGCCVLQKCIAHSTGEDQTKLVSEISVNGYELARDPFGNYVVQYILDLKNTLAIANLVTQFEGKYVQLSIQKFSSNVVEKCLKIFGEDDRATIIFELLSVPHFEQLLQDPYANFVIGSALENSKGSLYDALEECILPHEAALRTNPYSKRIFQRLKK